MFEFSVARKYLSPRWRQLSVSIISLIAIFVISLVVWLVVVFFSVTNGLEKRWIQKLTAITAPVRLSPTDTYYQSYYYLIDTISANSNYAPKSIGEKLQSEESDPYDSAIDEEIPASWRKADLNPDGSLKDPVKLAYQAIEKLSKATATEFEITMGNMRLRLVREESSQSLTQPTQAFLNQAVYVGSLDPHNEEMAQTLLAVTPADLSNMLASLGIAADNVQEDNPSSINKLDAKTFSNKLKAFFEHVEIRELKTPEFGWVIPRKIFPDSGLLPVKAVYKGNRLLYVKISSSSNEGKSNEDLLVKEAEIEFIGHQPFLIAEQKREPLPARVSLIVDGIVSFPAQLMQDSLKNAKEVSDLQFNVEYEIFKGLIPYGSLKIAQAVIHGEHSPFWVQRQERILSLPTDAEMGDGVLFPKTFKDAGVLIGDQGYLSYYAPTPTAVQEQRVPIYVAGFYDPGIIPLGGKFLIANQQLTSLIRSAHATEESTVTNGINVRFANIDDADQVKQDLQKMFEQNGIASYWKIETFKEFEFTKDLIQQLSSDKNLFTLIATVIIIVACSNIISMLIILVNDKKLEIGILRSMGASSLSIATIFGICSLMIGAVGSVIGVIAALITLTNLDLLVSLLSRIQGHQAFNPIFYGESLPNEVSFEALAFVVISTTLVSFVAGIIPAIKACLLKPSAILRSE